MDRRDSDATLMRADSGIDVISVEGVTTLSVRDWDTFQASSTSVQPSASENQIGIIKTIIYKIFPLNRTFVKWVTWVMLLGALFGAVYGLFPEQMRPGESLFGLMTVVLLSLSAEQLVVKIPTPKGIPPLPPLLASLLTGLALRNIPVINEAVVIDSEVSAIFRELALTVILTRAGLEIEPQAMKKVKWAVIRLAFLPCIVETLLIGVLAHYLLGFPFEWSFMTGFMIAAVSPAVVIPSLILLQGAGWGVAKGVPSLVMASSGIDDVLAIAGFTVLLGIAIPNDLEDDIINYMLGFIHQTSSLQDFSKFTTETMSTNANPPNVTSNHSEGSSDVGREVFGAIVEVIIGVVAGLLLGLILTLFPHSTMKYKTFCRGFLLLSIGILFVFGTTIWGIPGSGALCALLMSFTASIHWKDEKKPLAEAWHYMWTVFQPILFGLTGFLVDVQLLDPTTVGLGLAVLGVALTGRLATSTAVTFGLKFNFKERLFVSIAWIPKGTVQAALGSAALDQVLATNGSSEQIRWGEQILVLAVLITLITAPLGGFGISISGPRLLTKDSSYSNEEDLNNFENEGFSEDDSGNDSRLRRGSRDSINVSKRNSLEGKTSRGVLELKMKDSLDGIKEEDESSQTIETNKSQTDVIDEVEIPQQEMSVINQS